METKEQAKQRATAQALAKLKEILENNENLAKLVNGEEFTWERLSAEREDRGNQ